jgi:hypothetical protein
MSGTQADAIRENIRNLLDRPWTTDEDVERLHARLSVVTLEDEPVAIDDDERECDSCGVITDAGEWPDWINGSCESCDPDILDHEDNQS